MGQVIMDGIAYWFSGELIALLIKLGIYESIGSSLEARETRLALGYILMILVGGALWGISKKVGSEKVGKI